MAALIDKNTLIDYGLQLSKNFALEHMTTGAFHNTMGKIIPTFPAKLLPWQPNGMFSNDIPLWKLVQNLQVGSLGLVESLLGSLGGDLNIMAGFLNNIPTTVSQIAEAGHIIGKSLDISINNFSSNPFQIVPDIAKIAKNATNLNVVYSAGMSWIHLDLNVQNGIIVPPTEGPKIASTNLATGETSLGNVPYFGWA